MRFFSVASCAVLVITAACSDQKQPGITETPPAVASAGADIFDDLQTRVVPSLPAGMRAEIAEQLNGLSEASRGDGAAFQRRLERSLASIDALLAHRPESSETVDLESIRLGLQTIEALRIQQ